MDYWANLVRPGTIANAAVCNICITSEHLSAIMHQAATANYLQDTFSIFSAAG